ncbi:MAG: Sir2 family NAD-dependent protein deacetylase [Bacteroidota bacterium]
MEKIVVLTGAGISAESGLKTFRDANGLWEGHDVMEVASPGGFAKNPELVLRFYNERRAQLKEVFPNEGHRALVRLEEKFEVNIITQNVDNLHELAGSSQVLHLHGRLDQACSVNAKQHVIAMEGDIQLGDMGEDGMQLRPNIVWFGESVPNIVPAAELASEADVFIIVGTSLVVYPAAGLMEYAPLGAPIYVVDPNRPSMHSSHHIEFIEEPATTGVPKLVDRLLK